MSGEPVELNKLNEKSQFMNEQKTKDENNQVTCCRSKHTKNCCIATGVFGCIFLVLGKFELLHIYVPLHNALNFYLLKSCFKILITI